MSEDPIIDRTRRYVRQQLAHDKTGHDWAHVERVYNLAVHIAQTEPSADRMIVQLGALLHDIADWKFHDGDLTAGPRATRAWLESQKVDAAIVDQVAYIVEHISFRGGTNKHVMQTIEGKIVQDADRLDGIGAIGIARTFTFGGARGREMHNPTTKPQQHKSFADFKKATMEGGTTINHFYEKLLRIKDGIHTEAARKLATQRHQFLEQFLQEFLQEWSGER